MQFYEVLDRVLALLQQEGRVSYRALKRQFALDDEYIEDLKAEIIDAKRLALDEEGKVLVWAGEGTGSERENRRTGEPQKEETTSPDARLQTRDSRPIHYTPRHLAQRILAEQAGRDARGAPDGERKTITALFADIKGSMGLIEDLDPEEAQHLIDPVLQLMMDAVHHYEGYVAQSTGDGIFAFFGAPLACEDHPQRALYAALRMQEENKRFAETLRREKGLNVQIRVGLNTGEVVLRSVHTDDLHVDYTPVGHATSLAARMERLAMPGSIVVSEYTHKLAEGYFVFKSLGAAQIKGVSEPINIYEVLDIGPLRTRLQVSARRGLTRFVGRQTELGQMRNALAQARGGHGQIVAVLGDPGVGKSRLCYEFKLLSQSGCLILETFSVAHGTAFPYLPLIDLLKNYVRIVPSDDERQKQEKILGKVLALDRTLEDTLPYLFALLGITEALPFLQEMDPQIKRQRTREAVKRLLVRESLNQPLILLFEDLQWLDAETQLFLHLLSESIATTRMVLLVNHRPEYQPEWGNETYYTQLRLDPLPQEDAEEVLSTLLEEQGEIPGISPLRSLKDLILTKTEGNPFFIEEIVRALFDQRVLARSPGGVNLIQLVSDIHIPPTVQGVLAARIDRLGAEEKELLQTLAVIGKEFSLGLLRRVIDKPEAILRYVLSHLQTEAFIYEQPSFPEPEYVFKHALTQEVAYLSLLLERRRALHERTARSMEEMFHDRLEDHASELAHHYSHSGNIEKAIQYLQMAGEQAVQHSAYAEAIGHLTTALELLTTMPDTPVRTRQELTLQITLGAPLIITKGYGVPEVAKVYTQAWKLYQQVEDSPELLPLLFAIWRFHFIRGDYQTAHELAGQFARLAQSVQDPTLLLPAALAPGLTLFRLGQFAAAQAHLEQGVALYNLQKHGVDRSGTFVYGADPGVMCLSYLSWILGHLGYLDQALTRSQQALTLAHELSHPFSEAFALQFAATVHRLRREGQEAQERAETVMTLASAQGFPYWVAGGTFVRGWALVEQGKSAEGIAQIRQGIAAWRALGVERLGQPHVLLAEACGEAGEVGDGFALLGEALTELQATGERWWEAELYRVKGELTLAQSGVQRPASGVKESSQLQVSSSRCQNPSTQHLAPSTQTEAEACFQQAIAIARHQQAKLLELRAVMSLSRLWQQQGKKPEAHRLLAEAYGWFAEGFEAADLREAQALLEELTQR